MDNIFTSIPLVEDLLAYQCVDGKNQKVLTRRIHGTTFAATNRCQMKRHAECWRATIKDDNLTALDQENMVGAVELSINLLNQNFCQTCTAYKSMSVLHRAVIEVSNDYRSLSCVEETLNWWLQSSYTEFLLDFQAQTMHLQDVKLGIDRVLLTKHSSDIKGPFFITSNDVVKKSLFMSTTSCVLSEAAIWERLMLELCIHQTGLPDRGESVTCNLPFLRSRNHFCAVLSEITPSLYTPLPISPAALLALEP
ncbi:hypothetical protein T10_4552 [Trichinella papuae]|uniref:Uncharacterized protein n=1 Tax=Trichinella papuae TaxID=268474 RepID=A0A0V1M3F9_9BILA|nr:hypothetical protein T10_4552 [Trichinella papuae]